MGKPEGPLYIGVDLGGTNIGAGVVCLNGEMHGYERTKTKAELGPDAVVDRIVGEVEDACKAAGVKVKDIKGLGVGAPGTCDFEKGIVKFAVNLRWRDFPLGPELSKKLGGIPVVVDNDVNVGAWGEFKVGAAKDYDDMLAVFVGTGVGAGLVLNKKLYYGHYMTAGEIGQTVMDFSAIRGRNRLEQLAGRASITNHLMRLVEQNYDSSISDALLDPEKRIGSKKLSTAYEEGDSITVEALDDAAKAVGVAIANQVTMLSLPCVVVGGGVMEALGKPWLAKVRAAFDHVVHPPYLQDCKILVSKLEDHAGIVGAALLAADRYA